MSAGLDKLDIGRPWGGFTDQELALAMELRIEGCSWVNIAFGLGASAQELRMAVRRAETVGMRLDGSV